MTFVLVALAFLAIAGGLFALGSALLLPVSSIGARLNTLLAPAPKPGREKRVAERVDRGFELLSKAGRGRFGD